MRALFLALFLTILPLSLAAQSTAGDLVADATAAVTTHTDVQTGAYILRLSKVSPRDGSFDVDMWLWFRWKGADIRPDLTFELANGIITSRSESQVEDDGGTNYATVRVQATLFHDFDVRRFPLDNHIITLNLEDAELNNTQLSYVADEGIALDPAVNVAGWKVALQQPTVTAHVYNTNYGLRSAESAGGTYSRFALPIALERTSYGPLFKSFWISALAVLLGLLAFLIAVFNPAVGERKLPGVDHQADPGTVAIRQAVNIDVVQVDPGRDPLACRGGDAANFHQSILLRGVWGNGEFNAADRIAAAGARRVRLEETSPGRALEIHRRAVLDGCDLDGRVRNAADIVFLVHLQPVRNLFVDPESHRISVGISVGALVVNRVGTRVDAVDILLILAGLQNGSCVIARDQFGHKSRVGGLDTNTARRQFIHLRRFDHDRLDAYFLGRQAEIADERFAGGEHDPVAGNGGVQRLLKVAVGAAGLAYGYRVRFLRPDRRVQERQS